MNPGRNRLTFGAALLLLAATTAAHADSGWYAGGSYGASAYHQIINCDLEQSPYSQCSDSGTGHAIAVLAGYHLLPEVALEAGYTSFGKDALLQQPYHRQGWLLSRGFTAALVGTEGPDSLPALSFSARLGLYALRTQVHIDGTVIPSGGYALDIPAIKESGRNTGPLVGLGINYAVTPHYTLHLDWQSLHSVGMQGTANINTEMLGLTYALP